MSEEKNWYVIHTYSGHEKKVKANLEKRISSTGMDDKIHQIIVPTEKIVKTKNGEKKVTERKVFPGYVLVEMNMEDDSWYIVRNTPGVTGFVGSVNKPIPLQEDEIENILRQMGVGSDQPRFEFEVGQKVKVIDGPFEGFAGEVEEIDPERGKLKVLVSMFGRETPVELESGQVAES